MREVRCEPTGEPVPEGVLRVWWLEEVGGQRVGSEPLLAFTAHDGVEILHVGDRADRLRRNRGVDAVVGSASLRKLVEPPGQIRREAHGQPRGPALNNIVSGMDEQIVVSAIPGDDHTVVTTYGVKPLAHQSAVVRVGIGSAIRDRRLPVFHRVRVPAMRKRPDHRDPSLGQKEHDEAG